ncbi:hypothetical protein Avbf_08850 [Armadillidium vulgare]|nr:hypothetical protein Avbf_08850 [Armadillidium vulgare]
MSDSNSSKLTSSVLGCHLFRILHHVPIAILTSMLFFEDSCSLESTEFDCGVKLFVSIIKKESPHSNSGISKIHLPPYHGRSQTITSVSSISSSVIDLLSRRSSLSSSSSSACIICRMGFFTNDPSYVELVICTLEFIDSIKSLKRSPQHIFVEMYG